MHLEGMMFTYKHVGAELPLHLCCSPVHGIIAPSVVSTSKVSVSGECGAMM
jgi:hypothetical protein